MNARGRHRRGRGRGQGNGRGSYGRPEKHDSPEERDSTPDPADEEQLRDIGYRPSTNQLKNEPIPASTYAERNKRSQEAIQRNEDAAAASARAKPDRGSRHMPLDEDSADHRQPGETKSDGQ
ncbi:MAG TPA: hypothetical protein VFQ44_02830 [Streptosporangiaceae bacterium]|nr:hypothetical protein [Streptosporangiaceae bacterium]